MGGNITKNKMNHCKISNKICNKANNPSYTNVYLVISK